MGFLELVGTLICLFAAGCFLLFCWFCATPAGQATESALSWILSYGLSTVFLFIMALVVLALIVGALYLTIMVAGATLLIALDRKEDAVSRFAGAFVGIIALAVGEGVTAFLQMFEHTALVEMLDWGDPVRLQAMEPHITQAQVGVQVALSLLGLLAVIKTAKDDRKKEADA